MSQDMQFVSVTVFTFALKLRGEDNWVTLYRLFRPPPFSVEITQLLFSAFAALFIGSLAVIVGRSNMKPLQDLRQGAAVLGRGDRAPDVPVRGAKDVQEIVVAFNEMNARVSQSTDYQIGLLRSLGHDIKGPLASVDRLVTDINPDETRAQIERRLGRVHDIIDSIMSFSRAVMRDGELERTDLAAILEAVIDEQVDLGAKASADVPDRLLVTCRINAMERCLRNVVGNAVKYGGSAHARLFVEAGDAVIQIDDTGPGIPPEALESVFQPFQRLAEDPDGTGLGLAIARTIVVDQGGTLTLSNRPEGGLRAQLRFSLDD
jgi:signal transduction histidine kinase